MLSMKEQAKVQRPQFHFVAKKYKDGHLLDRLTWFIMQWRRDAYYHVQIASLRFWTT